MELPGIRRTATIAGPDLIRDPQGDLLVLEDNLRTPSGIAYAMACREAIRASRVYSRPPGPKTSLVFERLKAAIRDMDPSGKADPAIVMLSDGPAAKAWFEHRMLAEGLGIPVVRASELESHEGRLIARSQGARIEIDVLYNRSSDESLRRDDGRFSPLGELLVGPLESGSLACVNSFGSGLADDKAVHCYVNEMIPFYLDEEPLLESVPGFDLGEPEARNEALERLDELVIKPRWSFGGQGLFFGPDSSAAEIDEIRSRLELNPSDYVAQPVVRFSVHPTVADDRLEPRHIDLRAFVVSTGGSSTTLPVALTRFAGEAGEMVVNSTQGGGAKDTWLPDADPAHRERKS
jgi:carboxylate-amine ligase